MPREPDLEVHLRTPEGAPFHGRCVALESALQGILASVEFPAERAPVLPIGAKTELEFRGGGLGSAMKVEARPVLRTDDAVQRCYCFRSTLTKSALLSLVNRRRSARVRPPSFEPVSVRILDLGEGAADVLLHDISATGLSILVEPALEQQLCSHERLRLAVRLRREKKAVEIGTAVRHRRLAGSAILYGLEVDGQIPELMRAHNRFWVYVSNLRPRATGRRARRGRRGGVAALQTRGSPMSVVDLPAVQVRLRHAAAREPPPRRRRVCFRLSDG